MAKSVIGKARTASQKAATKRWQAAGAAKKKAAAGKGLPARLTVMTMFGKGNSYKTTTLIKQHGAKKVASMFKKGSLRASSKRHSPR